MGTIIKQDIPTTNPNAGSFADNSGKQPKLLDRLSIALRSRHYSRRTEQTYFPWVKKYIFFHNVRHPAEMGEAEISRDCPLFSE